MSKLYATLFSGPQEVEFSGKLADEINEKAEAMTKAMVESMTEEEMYERLFGK